MGNVFSRLLLALGLLCTMVVVWTGAAPHVAAGESLYGSFTFTDEACPCTTAWSGLDCSDAEWPSGGSMDCTGGSNVTACVGGPGGKTCGPDTSQGPPCGAPVGWPGPTPHMCQIVCNGECS